MNFNIGSVAKVKDSYRPTAGIHKCKFVSITVGSVETTTNGTQDTMCLTVDIDGNKFSHNWFEPNSTERTPGLYGNNPSAYDHFMVALKQIISAISPEVMNKVNNGEVQLKGSFKQFVNGLGELLNPYAGVELEIKLLPDNKGYSSIPRFVAKLDKNDNPAIQTIFIGKNLTLLPKEAKVIEAAKNPTPTDMTEKKQSKDDIDLINSVKEDLSDLSDLPF